MSTSEIAPIEAVSHSPPSIPSKPADPISPSGIAPVEPTLQASPIQVNKNHQNVQPESTNEKSFHLKKSSPWFALQRFFRTKDKKSRAAPAATVGGSATNADPACKVFDEKLVLSNVIASDLEYIYKASDKLQDYQNHMLSQATDASKMLVKLKSEGTDKDLKELKKAVTKLKLQIPSKYQYEADEKNPHPDRNSSVISQAKQRIPEIILSKVPVLHKADVFKVSPEFIDFENLYNKLDIELKLCLLCFSVFPENAIIKKRLMVYWWIAEGFVPPVSIGKAKTEEIAMGGMTAEDYANEFFQTLMDMGFIEPINKKRSLFVGHCRIHPFFRSALIVLAERAKFFNFDEIGQPTKKFLGSTRACLVGNGLVDYEKLQKGWTNFEDLEKIHMIFNLKEPILEFKHEWFPKMKNLNILYLGRWKALATDHIEVEDTRFLDGLANAKHLKYFSLQGVSSIMELPESISELPSLLILDLRACHNLEALPEGIGSLQNLIHLDISECYLLNHMPKGLANLFNLKVLKGFVVGFDQAKNSCTLEDLAKLPKLMKLSIFTGLRKFPTDKHQNALVNFQELEKLTIVWGGGTSQAKSNINVRIGKQEKDMTKVKGSKAHGSLSRSNAIKFRSWKLKKLDLKCFPETTTPDWLTPANLESLEKLYIRGGSFSDIGQYQYIDDVDLNQDHWNVKVLRLKYLSELEMDWGELQELFPKLVYLEKVHCPKLNFFPTDTLGVWTSKQKANN